MEKDPRIIKTKKAIEDAFVSLVELKGYKNVKLVDIAKKAKVNRNTIYLHYESKEQIISSIIAGSMENEFAGLKLDQIFKIRNNRFKIDALYRAIFQVVDKKAELFRILLIEDVLIGYFNIELKKIQKAILLKLKKTTRNELVISYLTTGVFNIITEYIIHPHGTAQEITRLLSDLTMSTLRRIQL